MLIIMERSVNKEKVDNILERLSSMDVSVHFYMDGERQVIGVVGETEDLLPLVSLEALPGVERVLPIKKQYKLASREFKSKNTEINVGSVIIGGNKKTIMAGPCAVESREQILETAQAVKEAGAAILRGGAYKPRTSPYSFQGLQEMGLKLLAEAREVTGLPVVTEIMDTKDIELVSYYADILQVGARNMQNYSLLKALSQQEKPVLLKRGLASTIEEWLMAAEYIMVGGNYNIILCERGIRTFEEFTRNTLDISAVVAVKLLSHLPVIADPSHASGKWQLVGPLAKAAIVAGADGVIVEVHPEPSCALSDGNQSLNFTNFNNMMREIKKLEKVI